MNAKQLFIELTGGTGNIDLLYGPHSAADRAAIMWKMYGKPVSKSQASWGVFRAAMWELFGATGDCIAAKDNCLREACK